jgi:RNA polymerase sigma-70 factor (ECF subfamily)
LAEQKTHILSAALPCPADSGDQLRGLIAACCRNDRQAQRQLFDAYALFIYQIIRRFTRDEPLVEEIQSEAFVRIFANLEQYRFEGPFEAWVRRITVNVVARHFRRQRPVNVALPEESEEEALFVDASAPGNIGYKQLLEHIYELPPTQRAVFCLFIFDEYNHREIAQLLDISENNSRWQMNEAMRRLKEKITASAMR